MTLNERLLQQFEILEKEGAALVRSYPTHEDYDYRHPWETMYRKWLAQSRNLIERICGVSSTHIQQFDNNQKGYGGGVVSRCLGIVEAAHSDYRNGMLVNLRHAVHAEISDDFLTQAEALCSQGYYVAAVSLAGAVLEDTLRTLCDKHGVEYNSNKTSLEALNVELARAGVYDRLMQKRITAEADLRNSADHGRFDNVKQADAEAMLQLVRRFVSEWLP